MHRYRLAKPDERVSINNLEKEEKHHHEFSLLQIKRALLIKCNVKKIFLALVCTLCSLVMLLLIHKIILDITFDNPCNEAKRMQDSSKQSSLLGYEEIPKIIHQQWKDENVPGMFSQWRQQWKELFPETEGYRHILWTDKSADKFLSKHYQWFIPTYRGFKHPIQRADAVRYFILYHYGGIYADLDYQPFYNFWSYLPNDKVGLIESPYWYNSEFVQNSLMSSPRNHPFWNTTFQLLQVHGKSDHTLSSTGPWMLGEAVKLARSKKGSITHNKLSSNAVRILPCQNYHRVPTGEAFHAPLIPKLLREFVARSPLVIPCGDWKNHDNCQFGLHHNAVTWQGNKVKKKNLK